MYVDQFDFIDFFDDKYRDVMVAADNKYKSKIKEEGLECINGIGAVGILTQNQCVIRKNPKQFDFTSKKEVDGGGRHIVNENNIYKQIYSFLPENFNLMEENTYQNIDNKIIECITASNMRLRLVNNNKYQNTIIVELPFFGDVTSKQINMLVNVSNQIEEASKHLNKPIQVLMLFYDKELREENTLKNIIIPNLRTIVNDLYEPIVQDDVIIAQKINKLHTI